MPLDTLEWSCRQLSADPRGCWEPITCFYPLSYPSSPSIHFLILLCSICLSLPFVTSVSQVCIFLDWPPPYFISLNSPLQSFMHMFQKIPCLPFPVFHFCLHPSLVNLQKVYFYNCILVFKIFFLSLKVFGCGTYSDFLGIIELNIAHLVSNHVSLEVTAPCDPEALLQPWVMAVMRGVYRRRYCWHECPLQSRRSVPGLESLQK